MKIIFDPEITLREYGTNNLTSVTINYDIDGLNVTLILGQEI